MLAGNGEVSSMNSVTDITGVSKFSAAVILGSGLGSIAPSLAGDDFISYEEVPSLVPSTVEGHEGRLFWGNALGSPVLVFSGRSHLYEGRDVRRVVANVDAAAAAGCKTIVLTNAAGGINASFQPGDLCLISDHINLTGKTPIGPGDPAPFLDLTDLYDARLREAARVVDGDLKEGVYAGVTGPAYETPAEIGMLQKLGADMVGMSTVLEAIRARYLGARVLGISIITNRAAGLLDRRLDHAEVTEVGARSGPRLERLVAGVLRGL